MISDTDTHTRTVRPSLAALSIVLAGCLALGLVAVPIPASAGDAVTIVYFEPDEVDADAGETLEIELVVSDHGDYNGNGIDNLSVTVAYDPAVFDATDVEHGPMLADGNPDADVEGTVDTDDENGTVTIEQERTPSGEGATATETAATLTLAVADDAEPTTETLEITDAETMLVTGYPQSTVERDAEIRVEGGAPDDSDDAEAGDDDGDGDGPDGVTLADDEDETETSDSSGGDDANESDEDTGDTGDDLADDGDAGESESASESESDSEDDSVPGFAASAAVVALVAWLGLRVRR